MEARAPDGANQPEVAAVLGFSASWRYSSRLTGSVGLASKWSTEASDLSSEALGA